MVCQEVNTCQIDIETKYHYFPRNKVAVWIFFLIKLLKYENGSYMKVMVCLCLGHSACSIALSDIFAKIVRESVSAHPYNLCYVFDGYISNIE